MNRVYLLFREKAIDDYTPDLIGVYQIVELAQAAASRGSAVLLEWKTENDGDLFAAYRTRKIGSFDATDYYRIQEEILQ